MTLNTIMAEINKLKPFADEEVLEVPRETLGGRLSRQKRAKEDIKVLIESYRQALLNSAVFVLVTGSGKEAFTKLATETFGFFQADPEEFYSDIVNQIAPTLYVGKESSPNVLDVVSRVLENKALEVGITGYPLMTFRQEFRRFIAGKAEFQALLKQIISTQVGTEVVGAQAIKSIMNAALKAGHAGKTTPILLALDSVDSQLVAGLKRISHRVGVISVSTETVNGKDVMAALNDIRTQMNNNPSGLASFLVTSSELEDAAIKSAENFGAPETIIFQDEESFVAAAKELEKPKATRNKNKNT